MTQGCLCLHCLVTKTSRKRDNQGQWCQVGGTWFDGLLNNTEGYLFIKCCTSEVPGMGGTWRVFSCFNSTRVALEPKLYMREVQWRDNADDAYACSQWRCPHRNINPTQPEHPYIHTLRLRSSTASHQQRKGCSQQWNRDWNEFRKCGALHRECPDQLSEGQNTSTGASRSMYRGLKMGNNKPRILSRPPDFQPYAWLWTLGTRNSHVV